MQILTNDNATGLGTKLLNGFAPQGDIHQWIVGLLRAPSKITRCSIRSRRRFSHANSGPSRPVGKLLSSSGVPDNPIEMSVKTRVPLTTHNYTIVVPLETARAIVEAYCEKLAASPKIADDEQHRSLAPALARLLCAIIR